MNAAATTDPATRTSVAFPYLHEAILAVLLACFLAAAGAMEARFVQAAVQVELAGDAWPVAIIALVMGLIVISGGIDLSVGSNTALCAVALGLGVEAGANIWAAVALALATGVGAGLLNGVLIARTRIHPLVVTLATMAGYRGIALALTKGRTIQGFPASYGELVQGSVLGLPLPMWGFLFAAAAAAVFLSRSVLGRFVYAIGLNERAARLSGVPVTRIKLGLYSLSGLACGVGAVLLTSRYEQAKADFATGLELEVITAVVLGGISIFGGRGNIGGLVLGLALVHELNKFVPWHWHVSELSSLVTGGLLIGSVLLNSLLTKKRRR